MTSGHRRSPRSWLDSVADGEHRRLLHHYATWHLLRRLRATASAGPIGYGGHQGARRDRRVTARFLSDLAQRDLTLTGCRQADLDRWMAHATVSDKTSLRPFLRWAIKARRMPQLQLPPTNRPLPCPISHQQRLELIQRLHSDDGLDPTERVIGLLILLYAQFLTRITRLKIDDITIADRQMLIRLGDPSAPVPAPFDQIINEYLAIRPNLTTATNRGSRWLFPGRRAGQPIHRPQSGRGCSGSGSPTTTAGPAPCEKCFFSTPRGRGRHARLRRWPSRGDRRRSRRHLAVLRSRRSQPPPRSGQNLRSAQRLRQTEQPDPLATQVHAIAPV